jgi:aldose 1-epimerase
MELLHLHIGDAHLALAPDLGGAIAALSVAGKPVLRSWSGTPDDGPFAMASNVLVPFSNRVSGSGFTFRGVRYDLPANLSSEPFPIHGDGFQRAWHPEFHQDGTVRLVLRDGAIGPYIYRAEQIFELSDGGLSVRIKVENTGAHALPFGCGFHPWFPRTQDTRLSFECDGFWHEDVDHMPTNHVSLANAPDYDFSTMRALPAGWINNAFTQWQGAARISQGPQDQSVTLTADPVLSTAIIFSPGQDAAFFCFEPVSHPVDAHNQANQPGLRPLAPGDTLEAGFTLTWSENDTD